MRTETGQSMPDAPNLPHKYLWDEQRTGTQNCLGSSAKSGQLFVGYVQGTGPLLESRLGWYLRDQGSGDQHPSKGIIELRGFSQIIFLLAPA